MENSKKTNSESKQFQTPRGIKLCNPAVLDTTEPDLKNNFFTSVLPRIFKEAEKAIRDKLPRHQIVIELRLGEITFRFDCVEALYAWFKMRAKNNRVYFYTYELTLFAFIQSGLEVDFRKSLLNLKFRKENWVDMDNNSQFCVPVMYCESLSFPFIDDWNLLPNKELTDLIKEDFGLLPRTRMRVWTN